MNSHMLHHWLEECGLTNYRCEVVWQIYMMEHYLTTKRDEVLIHVTTQMNLEIQCEVTHKRPHPA